MTWFMAVGGLECLLAFEKLRVSISMRPSLEPRIIYIYIYTATYIYIYIQRERERESERASERERERVVKAPA
jgi:hypothetical protein